MNSLKQEGFLGVLDCGLHLKFPMKFLKLEGFLGELNWGLHLKFPMKDLKLKRYLGVLDWGLYLNYTYAWINDHPTNYQIASNLLA